MTPCVRSMCKETFFSRLRVSSLIFLFNNLYILTASHFPLFVVCLIPKFSRIINLWPKKKKLPSKLRSNLKKIIFVNFWMWNGASSSRGSPRRSVFQLLRPPPPKSGPPLSCLFHVAYNPVTADFLSPVPSLQAEVSSHISRNVVCFFLSKKYWRIH